MPRRSGRPGSAASLHISKPDISVNNGPSGAQGSEARVVVQQLPAVEPTEESGERLVQHCNTQQLSPTKKEGVQEVRTRLRPHRSSWRDRFSPDEKKPAKTPAVAPPESHQKVKPKALNLNYPSEDVASIERNLQLPLQQNTSPDKQKGNKAKGRGRPSGSTKVLTNGRKPEKRNRTPSTETPIKVQKKPASDIKVGKPCQTSGKQVLKAKTHETATTVEKKKMPAKQAAQAECSEYCELCGKNVVSLQLHMQNKHKNNQAEHLQKANTENRVAQEVKEKALSAADLSRAEALQIARTVQCDDLIQKFGVRLLGMSLDPEQKILAVSQRMIELVRLLRAAQGLESSVESLAHLLHYDQWPLITQAILYVAGYDQATSTFRNPAFVFDIGQALKFSAHILKNEASASMDAEYEWQLKDFMSSIDGKIEEILPNAFQYRNFVDESTLQDVQNTETCESNDINELITTLNGEAGQEGSTLAEILPQVMDVSQTVSMSNKDADGDGEQQASLLLELSRGYTCIPEPEMQNCQPQAVMTQQNIKVEPVVNTVSVVSSNSNKKFSSPQIRILKVVSPSGQSTNRKFCLIIPSEVVHNSKVLKAINSQDLAEVLPATSSSNDSMLTSASEVTQAEQPELILAPCGDDITNSLLTSCGDVSSSTALLESDIAMLTSSEDIESDMNSQESDLVSVSATLLETPPPMTQLDQLSEPAQPRHTLASLCGVILENEQQ